MKNTNTQCSILYLPKDCLMYLINFLEFHDINNFMFTCKTIYGLNNYIDKISLLLDDLFVFKKKYKIYTYVKKYLDYIFEQYTIEHIINKIDNIFKIIQSRLLCNNYQCESSSYRDKINEYYCGIIRIIFKNIIRIDNQKVLLDTIDIYKKNKLINTNCLEELLIFLSVNDNDSDSDSNEIKNDNLYGRILLDHIENVSYCDSHENIIHCANFYYREFPQLWFTFLKNHNLNLSSEFSCCVCHPDKICHYFPVNNKFIDYVTDLIICGIISQNETNDILYCIKYSISRFQPKFVLSQTNKCKLLYIEECISNDVSIENIIQKYFKDPNEEFAYIGFGQIEILHNYLKIKHKKSNIL